MAASWLWAVFTVIAAFTQTVRNAAQRELTGTLGTVGATHVRFLFGFPFALVFLVGLLIATGAALPRPGLTFWPWVIVGAFAQVAATALMLAAMGERSFVVTIAYIKTEPIQVAIFGLIFLGDVVTWPMMVAIVIATAGVVIMSTNPLAFLPGKRGSGERGTGGIRPTLLGLASGAMFALSAVGFRGAILSPGNAELRGRRELHSRGRHRHAGNAALALSGAPPALGAVRHRARLEALIVRRLCRRRGFAVLVSRLRAGERRECTHARFDRGVVRAGDRPVRVRPAHQRAKRSAWCWSSPASRC